MAERDESHPQHEHVTGTTVAGGIGLEEVNARKGENQYDSLFAIQARMLVTQQTHYETVLANERSHTENLRSELVRGIGNRNTTDFLSTLRHLDTGGEEARAEALASRGHIGADVNAIFGQSAMAKLADALVPTIVEAAKPKIAEIVKAAVAEAFASRAGS